MSWNRRVHQYQKFWNSLKRAESTLCSCPAHLHPRPWVPPPCLTSRAQGGESFYHHRRSLSNPELRMRSSTLHAKTDDSEHHQQSLQHMYNEARVLKEALSKVRQGDSITRDSRSVIKKWSNRSPRHRTKSDTNSQSQKVNPREEIAELDKSFAEAVQEEESLKQELRNLREIAQNRAAFEEENVKLKKKIRQLQHRIKRQDEAQRVSRESLQAEREMGTRDEYILLSLKKKYDDLLQYVLKVESENQKLKSLHGMSGDGDDFLHDYDRENNEYERHDMARLQTDLEALRAEVMKKDNYILECEERLQAVDALKEENLTLHKSLRNHHDTAAQPDPRDVVGALEEEWMKRLSETREMYERAIEGYRSQLQEMQSKFQEAQVNHASHVNELIQDIDELKTKRSPKYAASDSNLGSSRIGGAQADQAVGKAAVIDAAAESEKASISSDEDREQSLDAQEAQQNIAEIQDYKMKEHHASNPKKVVRVSNQTTQTLTPEFLCRESTDIQSENNPSRTDVRGPQGEMRESKEYLERVNLLVKRLESLKLNGEGAEAILSVIRDTINDCLHDWRESFQQQKASERDSADENKGYVELQRKLRTKSKQLESKQKHCKQLEEHNSKLTKQCSQLEIKIAAVEASDRLGMLQDLPQTLRNTEERLSEFQEAFQKAQGEKSSLQNQIMNLSEKVSKKEMKLVAGHEQILTQEEEMKRLQENLASLKHQLEEGSREIVLLKEQLSTKDTILEHTSAQLEERIRECAGLSTQIERQETHMNQEARNIKVQLNEHENSSHKQILESQALAARYQAQLSALRSEKEHNEKSLRHNMRKLEEQVDQLQLRNSTLQRQLTTITSTYHSMFASVDINNHIGSHGISNAHII